MLVQKEETMKYFTITTNKGALFSISCLMSLLHSPLLFAHGSQSETWPPATGTPSPVNKTTLDAAKYGRWETVTPVASQKEAKIGEKKVPENSILGMQSIHTILLPSGKILMVNGSSNRLWGPDLGSEEPRVQTYSFGAINPGNISHLVNTGINNREPLQSRNTLYQDVVNNNGILDLDLDKAEHERQVTLTRIPSPELPADQWEKLKNGGGPEGEEGLVNDLFCSGHLHTPDGNVLFVGGTNYYHGPFTGSKYSYLFNWEKELELNGVGKLYDDNEQFTRLYGLWDFAGYMGDGHWYPNIVPLEDGRMVVFSGLSHSLQKGQHRWLRASHEAGHSWVSQTIEIFDPEKWDAGKLDSNNQSPGYEQDAWKSIDVGGLFYKNSPFNTPLDSNTELKDGFMLYPRNYALPRGEEACSDVNKSATCEKNTTRILLSDGTEKVSGETKNTYVMKITGTREEEPSIAFEHGPDRHKVVTQYGSTVVDPNSGNILSIGGQRGRPNGQSGNIFNGHGPLQQAGIRVTGDLEVYTPPKNWNTSQGSWGIEEEFLGNHPSDVRMNHYITILPTKQLLVINGGNFAYERPVYSPLLLDPIYSKEGLFSGKYHKTRMNEGNQPRFYHNGSVLLPDARVLVTGSNPASAVYYPPSEKRFRDPLPNVNVDVFQVSNLDLFNLHRDIKKGEHRAPAEGWIAEIFSPPYLALPGPRPSIAGISTFNPMQETTDVSFKKGGKTFYNINYQSKKNASYSQSPDNSYQVDVANVPTHCSPYEGSLVLVKLGSSTHGWDSGQRLIDLKFRSSGLLEDQVIKFEGNSHHSESGMTDKEFPPYPLSISGTLVFKAPLRSPTTPPGYYMMFYVNCVGKPSVSKMIKLS